MLPHRRTTIRDIQTRLMEKEQEKIQIYETILNMIYHRIETAIQFGQLLCVYRVPEVLPGKPLFNMTQCVVYIIHHFKQGGFEAQYVHPLHIVIQWPHAAHSRRTLTLDDMTANDLPDRPGPSTESAIPTPTYADRQIVHKENQQRHRDNMMFDYIPKRNVRS
jgi:hypothetical protein